MKEQLLKIILDNGWTDGDHIVGKEIETFVFEFIEWKDKDVGNPNRNGLYLYWEDHFTLLGLFDYWFKNIKLGYIKEPELPLPSVEMTPVSSSQIKSIGYRDLLYIEFLNGTVYSYAVPKELYAKLMAVESKGKFFASEIKNKCDWAKTDKKVVEGKLV
jgi:hypothetical protein